MSISVFEHYLSNRRPEWDLNSDLCDIVSVQRVPVELKYQANSTSSGH